MRVDVERRLTREQGSSVVGETVEAHQPSALEPGTVLHDAETGQPILAYMPLADAGPLRRALLKVDCGSGVQRNRNYRSRSRTFGYAPPRPVLQRDGCTLTALSMDQPDVARTLESYADQFSRIMTDALPDVAEQGRAVLGEVLPSWRLGSAKLWTSGVINDTAQLPYHRDGFNFPVWSAMPVLRRGTRGGHLHLPEYGLVVPCADATVTFFEGFRWVHGVTPITRVKAKEGYRISVVYYALRGMRNCREAAEETVLAAARRTAREREMARRLAGGERGIPNALGSAQIDGRRLDRRVSSANWRFKPDEPPPKARQK
jgi:hypothetical protein